MRTLYVPIGLPGAGKTTYFKSQNFGTRIDMDKYVGKKLNEVLIEVLKTSGDLYLDGLFITETSQKIIEKFNENIIYIFLDTPKEICLIRDAARVQYNIRKKNSISIIKNAKIHLPKKYLKQI